MQVKAILTPAPEGGFTVLNPETGTVSEGESIEQAIAHLHEAVELYFEVFPMKLGAAPLLRPSPFPSMPDYPIVSGVEIVRPPSASAWQSRH